MANSIKMEDPDGKEFDIVAAGVDSLERLGWKRVEDTAKADEKTTEPKTTASKTTASKTSK